MWILALQIVLVSLINGICLGEQPYTVQNEALEPFKGIQETCVDMSNLKTVGRQRFVNGTVKFLEEMDSESFKFQVELFSSPNSDGQYKRLPMGVPITRICDGFKDLYTKIIQPSLIQGENTDFPHVPDEGLCPLPIGEFYIKTLEFNTDTWPNQIPRGTLKAVLTFFKNEVSVGGTVMKMKIEDRQ
ncbi:PREDICTED: uncharacterized protein LOC108366658 [Rhagoletis zephyria]|uniref:uncharacterized protein LOC108366658 n=1 Tax=Rhagoletis zephyria TaxID=28612 RepID=UPI0008113871|nr:PREDICTED: uncharacterized protein LOC108366658 [Rhagoletis zephyria]XP_036332290.1 uncharacterized protein LOC118743633 [Rhagoletis pomonella]